MTINWPEISTFGTVHGMDLKTLNEVAWALWAYGVEYRGTL